MELPQKPKIRRRYSIGEWYGLDFEGMTPLERKRQALEELRFDGLTGKPCPFQNNVTCNKKGGVCSLRLYEQQGDGPVRGVDSIISTCPNRFLEGHLIFQWVGETLLETSSPIVLSEIGFLDRAKPEDAQDEESSGEFIGRIDNVLIHPNRKPMDWCALEIQAVYFSGIAMKKEFVVLSRSEADEMPFPAAHRRPDWRSSGPKRLLPQLQTKTPTIRTWGKKIAVVVDEPFFASLIGLDRERHLSNAEIVWFIVAYEQNGSRWRIIRKDAVFTKLESSVKALTGGVPLSKEAFEEQLFSKLKTAAPSAYQGLRM